MTFSTRNFDPLTQLALKFPNFAIQILYLDSKIWEFEGYCFFARNTLLPSSHMHMCYNIFTPLGYGGVACLKQRLGPKLEGAGLGEHPKNWDPYVFLQPLKLATSNLVHNLGLGLAYQKQHFGPQLASVLARGASKNNCDPPMYFLQLLKLTTSNLVHKLGLELAYQKRRLLPKLAGVWAREASKKIWDPYVFLQPLKLATSNLVPKVGLGLAYQKDV